MFISRQEYLKRYLSEKENKLTVRNTTTPKVLGVGNGATEFVKGLLTARYLDKYGTPILIESDSLKVFKRVERRRHDRALHNDGSGWVCICDAPKKSSSVKRIRYDTSSPPERKNSALPLPELEPSSEPEVETPLPLLERKPSQEAQVKPPLPVMKLMEQPKPEVKRTSSISPDLDLSPPRRRRRSISQDLDLSPPRRRRRPVNQDLDLSPPRRRSSRYLTLSDLNITFSDLKSKSSRRPEPYDPCAAERPDLSPPRNIRKYSGRHRPRNLPYSRRIHRK